jgi:monoamine oxidase
MIHPIEWAVSRWWDDPWSRGAWSLLRVGATASTRAELGAPIGDRLILVGEATHPDQAGMTHGAFDEGRRAARWAIDAGHRRVLVVGAGFAGLGAARDLADAGLSATVLEARDRLGGRACSHSFADGTSVELGANWLQQGDRNTLAPIAAQLGLRTVPTDFAHPLDLEIGTGARAVDTEPSMAAVRRCLSDQPDDVSLAQALSCIVDVPDLQRVVDLEIALDAGAPLDDLSACHGFEPGVGAGDRWIVGGYGQLVDHLATGLDIRVNTAVTHVEGSPTAIRVCTAAGDTLDADAVIVTTPAAVLRAGAITFDPPLPPSHQSALAHITAGRVDKVALRFERRWWTPSPSSYLRIAGGTAGNVSEWLDLTDALGVPIITAIFVGDWLADMWDDRTDEQVALAATNVLAGAMAGVSS